MNPKVWAEIVAAYEDALRVIEGAFADKARMPDFAVLRGRLRRRLDELFAAISPPLTPEEAARVILPLTYLIDELVEVRVVRASEGEPPEWPQLQTDLSAEGNGGDELYEEARALLRRADAPPLLVGVYLFCLQAGFQGKLVEDPSAIPRWKTSLAERLPAAPAGASSSAATSFARPRPGLQYVAAVAGAVLALQIVLLAIARAM